MIATDSSALPCVHLSAGQLIVTREAQVVVTVLGSCVAVTMFHPLSGLSAICHAMLPHPRPMEIVAPGDPVRFRYVSHAVPAMLKAYQRAGVEPWSIAVKVFGGGNVLSSQCPEGIGHRVGLSNLLAAHELLDAAGMTVRAENTAGHHGRKILFNTATGEVLHKQLRRLL